MLATLGSSKHRSSSCATKKNQLAFRLPDLQPKQLAPLEFQRKRCTSSPPLVRYSRPVAVQDVQPKCHSHDTEAIACGSDRCPLSMVVAGRECDLETPRHAVEPPKYPKTRKVRPQLKVCAGRAPLQADDLAVKVEEAPKSVSSRFSLPAFQDVEDEDAGDSGSPWQVLTEPGMVVAVPKLSNLLIRRPRVLPPTSQRRQVRWPDPIPVRLPAARVKPAAGATLSRYVALCQSQCHARD